MGYKVTERLLTPEEAATRLGIKLSTVRRRILERRITSVKVGRNVRIPVEAVDELIARGWREEIRTGVG